MCAESGTGAAKRLSSVRLFRVRVEETKRLWQNQNHKKPPRSSEILIDDDYNAYSSSTRGSWTQVLTRGNPHTMRASACSGLLDSGPDRGNHTPCEHRL